MKAKAKKKAKLVPFDMAAFLDSPESIAEYLTQVLADGEPDELLRIFIDNGFAVAADDLAQESRQFRTDVPDGPEPFIRLARQWQELDGCSLAINPLKPRGQMLIDMARGADAVIICMMKFCDPEGFDYPLARQEVEKAGYKVLYLEVEQRMESLGQAQTRIQSFAEMF